MALNIAKIHNLRKNFSAAEKQFIHALSIDDSNSSAHHGLGVSLLKQNKKAESIDEFLMALEGNFYMPNTHFFLVLRFILRSYILNLAMHLRLPLGYPLE